MDKISIIVLSSLICILLGKILMPIYKKYSIGQSILKYVKEHKTKEGTLTCGGVFFCLSSIISYFVFEGFNNKLANASILIGLAYLIVGFLDDFIKIKTKNNLGLKAYQKIIFQTLIAIISGIFAYRSGINSLYIPFVKNTIHLGYATIPLIALVFIATTNSVNLTDGLDGLASWTSIPFFLSISIILILETNFLGVGVNLIDEFSALSTLSLSLLGGLLGFLIFNVSKAKIFMGDTGSMALGGFMASICVFSANSLFLLVLGIMFVMSSISVIIQVLVYKKTKKRVFLMAPLHHHLQKKGHSEAKISYYYFYITLMIGILLIVAYL